MNSIHVYNDHIIYIYISTTCKQHPKVLGTGLSIKLYLSVFTIIYTPPSFTAAPLRLHFPPLPPFRSPFTLPTRVVSKMPGLSRNSFTSLSWRPLESSHRDCDLKMCPVLPPKNFYGTLKIQPIEKEKTSELEPNLHLLSS